MHGSNKKNSFGLCEILHSMSKPNKPHHGFLIHSHLVCDDGHLLEEIAIYLSTKSVRCMHECIMHCCNKLKQMKHYPRIWTCRVLPVVSWLQCHQPNTLPQFKHQQQDNSSSSCCSKTMLAAPHACPLQHNTNVSPTSVDHLWYGITQTNLWQCQSQDKMLQLWTTINVMLHWCTYNDDSTTVWLSVTTRPVLIHLCW